MIRTNNILIIVSGNVVGGHENQLVHLLQDLREMDASVKILCADNAVFDYLSSLRFEATKIDVSIKGKLISKWFGAKAAAQKMGSFVKEADQVFISGGTIEACIPFARASKLVCPQKIVSAYIPMHIDRSITHGVIGLAYNCLVNWMSSIIDQFLTINRIQARLISANFGGKVYCIRNIVQHVRLPSTSFGRRLIYVGRFDDKQKALIELIGLLDTKDNPFRQLILIGDGPDKGRILSAANEATKIQVNVLGWMSTDAIDSILGTEDCLILNSRWEGEPLVIREFSARGLPCVARDIDGVRGIVPRFHRYSNRLELLSVLNEIYYGEVRSCRTACSVYSAVRRQKILFNFFGR